MPHCLPLPGSPLCFRTTQFCLRQEKKAGKKENSVREAGGAPWGVCTPWHGLWDAARAERPVGTRLPPAPRGTEGQLALGQGDRRAWRLRTVDTPRPNPGPEKPPTKEEKHVVAPLSRRGRPACGARVMRGTGTWQLAPSAEATPSGTRTPGDGQGHTQTRPRELGREQRQRGPLSGVRTLAVPLFTTRERFHCGARRPTLRQLN